MPSAATQSPGTTAAASRGGGATRPSVPFIRASAEHVEAPFFDQTYTQNTGLQDFGVVEVPAYGYIRNIVVMVTAQVTANVTNSVTFNEDAPFTALQNLQFSEPNGAQIVQLNDGYELYLVDKYSGFMGPGLSNDHRADPGYSQITGTGATAGTFSYMLRIPVELDCRSGLGSLPNQAANATFRVRGALAPLSVVFGVAPSVAPTIRVRMFSETWDQPEVASGGVQNQVTPPAMNTTAFLSRQVYNVGSGGSQTVRLTRVGNYLRNNIFILRSGAAGIQGAGQRFNANELWTSVQTTTNGIAQSDGQVTFYIDSRPIQVINDRYWRMRMWERSGGYGGFVANAAATEDGIWGPGGAGQTVAATNPNALDEPYGLDFGVRVLDWAHEFDGNYGRENRDLWQPTLGSTRFEIQSSFGALTNGTLTVLTNDVAIAGNVFLS